MKPASTRPLHTLLLALALLLPGGLAESAPTEEEALPSCGDQCRASGLEVTVTELGVPVAGFSLDQVDAAWREATRDMQAASPRLSGFEVCYKCGSTELAEQVSLRYELTVPLPTWEPSETVSPSDRSSILRYIAALQGRANRLAANHRDALAEITVKNQRPSELQEAIEAACARALQADGELLVREGCVEAAEAGGVRLAPMTNCQSKWKAPALSRCRIQR